MKKIFFSFMLAVLIIFANVTVSKAADVWFYYEWVKNNGGYGVDYYLVEDSVIYGDNEKGRYVRVVTKEVVYGQLAKTTSWLFEDLRHCGDWRYQTERMKDHTCRVQNVNENISSFPEIILRYCLDYVDKPF